MLSALLVAALTLGLILPPSAAAELETFGTDLTRSANSARTCETGFFDPALIAGTGFPYTPYASCTWWSVGGIQGTGNSIVPHGGGTVTRIRVKVGAVTGRMQVVALRLMRHPGSLADPACCLPAGSGPVFTPTANAVTELAVDLPVKHETDARTGVTLYDVLALSVLDPGVPVPAEATGDGGWSGVVGGMFPAYVPGTEAAVGYGAIMPGHVLLSADLEPSAISDPPRTPTPLTTPAPGAVIRGGSTAIAHSGALRIKISCDRTTGCLGRVVVTRGRSVLARARIDVAPGAVRVVRVPLTRAGRRALSTGRTVKATASVRLGGELVASRTLTLKGPARRERPSDNRTRSK